MATIAILFIIYATGKELDSGSSARKGMEVQVLLTAPLRNIRPPGLFSFAFVDFLKPEIVNKKSTKLFAYFLPLIICYNYSLNKIKKEVLGNEKDYVLIIHGAYDYNVRLRIIYPCRHNASRNSTN